MSITKNPEKIEGLEKGLFPPMTLHVSRPSIQSKTAGGWTGRVLGALGLKKPDEKPEETQKKVGQTKDVKQD